MNQSIRALYTANKNIIMKNFILSLLVLFSVQQLNAQTFYDQLCMFNYNWAKYEAQAPKGEAKYLPTDKEYVEAHLGSVLEILRANPTDNLDTEQYQSRNYMIQLLDGYRQRGIFPINYHKKERIPVFIDEDNTYCAVAYLLLNTGYKEVAERIAKDDNYIWVKEIDDPDFPAWQQSSGLTLEELKLIQGAYDFYMDNALFLPNKYEVPQKPEPMIVYFENKLTGGQLPENPENIWCKGEEKNGVLHGRWEQNYAVGTPWIEGYYDQGERTGQWKEYYKGTTQLCRTENWRNDKLNGVRKRFDRTGKLIEEIVFEDGEAIKKTNYDLNDSLTYIRYPLDSGLMRTEVYTLGGYLLAKGNEKVYNPGGLQWFQNIELTALNSAAISAQSMIQPIQSQIELPFRYGRRIQHASLYNSPPLVQYIKEGEWKYYREYRPNSFHLLSTKSILNTISNDYPSFATELFAFAHNFDHLVINSAYDEIRIIYSNNHIKDFYGIGKEDYAHLSVTYYETERMTNFFNSPYFENNVVQQIKSIQQHTEDGKRIGTWKYFDYAGTLYKTENYLVATKEDQPDLGLK